MRGPSPKDPRVRQRKNVPATSALLDHLLDQDEPATAVARPELPEREETERAWHRRTVAWWASVWSSPMARRYLDADVHGLLMAAELVDQFWYKPTASLAAELRRQLEQFGLSVMSRRRLDWRIRDEPPAEAPAAKQAPARRRVDPREAAFRVLDGGRQ